MSPIPIREALRNLVAEALVDPLPQRGFRVRPISLPDLDDIYRVRLVIEPMALRMAIPRLDARSLREAELANRRLLMVAADTNRGERPTQLADYHHAFHFSIYRQCGSPWLIQFSEQLWKHSERYFRLALYYEPDRVTEHGRILAACRERNLKVATQELTSHLRRSHRRIRAAVEPHLADIPHHKVNPRALTPVAR
jgi:DNA-binding GntR family transcriptional regulator